MDGGCLLDQDNRLPSWPGPLDCGVGVGSHFDRKRGLGDDSIEMTNAVDPQGHDRAQQSAGTGVLHWRSRYDGLLTIAELDGRAVAGISGPWSGQYALTWWDRPLPTRSLDLFDSLEAAKQEIETWAARMRLGIFSSPVTHSAPTGIPACETPVAPSIAAIRSERVSVTVLASANRSLLGWMRGCLGKPAERGSVERSRQQQLAADDTLGDELHFSADEQRTPTRR